MVDELVVFERGVLSVPDEIWELAVQRARVIGPLAGCDVVGGKAVEAAAAELDVSVRQVYVLLRRWRVIVAGVGRDPIPKWSAIPTRGDNVNLAVVPNPFGFTRSGLGPDE